MRKITLCLCTLICLLTFSKSSNAQWVVTSKLFGSSVYSLASSGVNTFAGAYGAGVFLSTDNGNTWTAVNSGLANLDVNTLLISGSNIFAGTDGGGIYLSTNNGSSWSSVNNGIQGPDIYVKSLSVSGSNLYAATGNGMFLSTNNGSSWTSITSGLANPYLQSTATLGTTVFAGGYYGGIAYSRDSGKTWITSGVASEIYALAVSGSNVFAGINGGMYLSEDTGKTWLPVDSGLTNTDIRSLAVSGSSVFAGTDGGGVFVSTNNGTTWAAFNSGGLASGQIFALAANASSLFAGTNNTARVWDRPLSDVAVCVPMISSSDSTTFCQGDSVILSATAGISYLWNTGDITQNIVAKTAGKYACTVNTPCGNITSNVITLTIDSSPVVTITPNGPTTFCKSSTLTFTGNSANSYLWSTGKTTSSIKLTILKNDTITLTETGANGCRASSSIDITSIPYPVVTSQTDSQNVVANCFAGFAAHDTSIANLTYQWQVNTGLGFNNISNTGFYNGATTDSLAISDAVSAMNGYLFHCIISNSGCPDTSASARLIVHAVKAVSYADTLCAGDSVIVGTHTYYTSNTYIDTLRTTAGCDSLMITTHLAIDSTIKHTQKLSICAGGSYTIGVHTYNTAGTYIDSLAAGKGCDSIVTTILTINPPITSTQRDTLCAGDTITVGIHTYSATGTYIDTLTTLTGGCDSIVTTHLVIDSIIKHSQTVAICYGGSLTVGIHTYTTAGNFTDTIQNGRGCDSIVKTKITINPIIKFTHSDTLCAGDSLVIGIHTYTTANTYIDTLTTLAGCDSVLTTILSFRPAVTPSTQTDTLCAGDSLSVGIHIYTATGIYIDTLTSAHGCDSIVTTNLVIDSTILYSQTVSLCSGDSITVGIHTYNSPGLYTDSINTVGGCDSIVTTNLAIYPSIDTTTSVSSDTIKANASTATYKWINCAKKDSVLATTQSYLPKADGSYAVIVTINGCSDTSSCVNIIDVGIDAVVLNNSITVYPNPATNQLTIHSSSSFADKAVTISIINVVGEVMQEEKLKWSSDVSLNINNLPEGMYFLQMKLEDGSVVRMFVKE